MAAWLLQLNGLTVGVIEPTPCTGGMVGLNLTDLGQAADANVGGLTRQWFNNCGACYGIAAAAALTASNSWKWNEIAARAALNAIYALPGITVITGASPSASGFVTLDAQRNITTLHTAQGDFAARYGIVDTSDEVHVGREVCPLRWGRDDSLMYGEPNAGFQGPAMAKAVIAAVGTNYTLTSVGYSDGNMSYTIRRWPLARDGSVWSGAGWTPFLASTMPLDGLGEVSVQPACFRMHVVWSGGSSPVSGVPFPQPTIYNPEQFKLVAARQYFQSTGLENDDFISTDFPSQILPCKRLCGLGQIYAGALPAGYTRWEANSRAGSPSLNLKRGMDAYALASYATQQQIEKAHYDWQTGIIKFWATDPAVPSDFQAAWALLGLTPDEWQAPNCYHLPDGTAVPGWPPLYKRAVLTIIGQHFATDRDLFVPYGYDPGDIICLASYNADAHMNHDFADPAGAHVWFEGAIVSNLRSDPTDPSSARVIAPIVGTWPVRLGVIRPRVQDARTCWSPPGRRCRMSRSPAIAHWRRR
jgi:hypothetical protein